MADQPATTVATPGTTAGQSQSFRTGAKVPTAWWTLFGSKALDDLVNQALANNHDLKAAQAALLAAHETMLAQRGADYPNVSAGFSASRQRQADTIAPTPSTNAFQYSLFTPQLSISYVPDVFGLNRRTVEALRSQADASRYQMAATYLTLTTNVAAAAIQDASLEDQIDATRQIIELDGKALEILRYQLSKGYVSGVDVAAQETQLAQATASLPPLLKQAAQQRSLLATLTGRFPAQTPTPALTLASLTLPQDLPLSLPSDLVAQRPDVLQAQANMHAASAQIGIAAANRLPNIQLTGNAGSTALAISQVFAQGDGFWTLGADLTAPIFQGGALLHQERAAKAAYVQAAEQYRTTVLTAVQNVADTLTALYQDAQALKASAAALDASKVTLDLVQQQLRDGYASPLAVLNAEQAYQQARLSLVQAQADRFADTAALFQALGGGWRGHADLSGNKHEE